MGGSPFWPELFLNRDDSCWKFKQYLWTDVAALHMEGGKGATLLVF